MKCINLMIPKMSNEIEKSGNRKKSEYLKKYEKYEIRKSNKL